MRELFAPLNPTIKMLLSFSNPHATVSYLSSLQLWLDYDNFVLTVKDDI